MDIQQLIDLDKLILMKLNGSDSIFWDGFMYIVTSTKTWLPAAVALLYVIFKNNKFKHGMLILLMIALVIALADQTSSGICKPFFERFRPTKDPEFMYMVDTVNNYRAGGLFGFISSHAANTFAVAMFVSLLVKNIKLAFMMFLWALIPTYSRVYLGVHYPGDVFFGMLDGLLCGVIIYFLYVFISNKFIFKPKLISTQYTVSGYDVKSVDVVVLVLLLTYFFAVVYGMIISKSLYF